MLPFGITNWYPANKTIKLHLKTSRSFNFNQTRIRTVITDDWLSNDVFFFFILFSSLFFLLALQDDGLDGPNGLFIDGPHLLCGTAFPPKPPQRIWDGQSEKNLVVRFPHVDGSVTGFLVSEG